MLERVRETAWEAWTHQDYPFDQVVEAVNPERDLSRQPLFSVLLTMQNEVEGLQRRRDFGGLAARRFEAASGVAKFDLTVFLAEDDAGLHAAWEYSTELFEAATIGRFAAAWAAAAAGGVGAARAAALGVAAAGGGAAGRADRLGGRSAGGGAGGRPGDALRPAGGDAARGGGGGRRGGYAELRGVGGSVPAAGRRAAAVGSGPRGPRRPAGRAVGHGGRRHPRRDPGRGRLRALGADAAGAAAGAPAGGQRLPAPADRGAADAAGQPPALGDAGAARADRAGCRGGRGGAGARQRGAGPPALGLRGGAVRRRPDRRLGLDEQLHRRGPDGRGDGRVRRERAREAGARPGARDAGAGGRLRLGPDAVPAGAGGRPLPRHRPLPGDRRPGRGRGAAAGAGARARRGPAGAADRRGERAVRYRHPQQRGATIPRAQLLAGGAAAVRRPGGRRRRDLRRRRDGPAASRGDAAVAGGVPGRPAGGAAGPDQDRLGAGAVPGHGLLPRPAGDAAGGGGGGGHAPSGGRSPTS